MRCRLSAARADRDAKLAESEKLQELQDEIRGKNNFEVTALLSAARRRLPPCTPGSSTATLNQVQESLGRPRSTAARRVRERRLRGII